MNEHLRERIIRKLETLSDERGYQVLDYAEFLESRYAERQGTAAGSFSRFTDAIEDRLRAGRVSASAIAETMNLLNRASSVLNGAMAAGRSVANDIVSAAQGAPPRDSSPNASPPGSADPGSTTSPSREASSPAHDVPKPGSGEERL